MAELWRSWVEALSAAAITQRLLHVQLLHVQLYQALLQVTVTMVQLSIRLSSMC